MVWIRSYLHVNKNVEISCFNRNNFEIIKCLKILARKIEFSEFENSADKISIPPCEDERKHSFLVTSHSVEKQLSLVPNMFITLTATANKH